ncbi:MAG: methionyl-tRNA formyltransferase [Sphingomonadales bacterium]|nr:MAG: methionyl-tRNA formyltransferase [Sphingomonadales bacterium]
MRLVFMGTPAFAARALQALVDAGHDICAVYSQPPRPAHRGKKLTPSPVQALAQTLDLPVFTPLRLRDAERQAEFAAHRADVAVVAAYGLILPQPVLDAPRYGCLNIHASLLPRWRGAAPIQRAIEAGDTETGICIMQMEAGLDTGPVLLRRPCPIAPDETAATLHDRLAALGAEAIVDALAHLRTLTPQPQDESRATYAAKIDKAEAKLDWSQPAPLLERRVRAFCPAPGAYFLLGDERIRVLAAEVMDADGTPGTVLDTSLTIACGAQALRPTLVQRAGKAAMPTTEMLRGLPVAAGLRLE